MKHPLRTEEEKPSLNGRLISEQINRQLDQHLSQLNRFLKGLKLAFLAACIWVLFGTGKSLHQQALLRQFKCSINVRVYKIINSLLLHKTALGWNLSRKCLNHSKIKRRRRIYYYLHYKLYIIWKLSLFLGLLRFFFIFFLLCDIILMNSFLQKFSLL